MKRYPQDGYLNDEQIWLAYACAITSKNNDGATFDGIGNAADKLLEEHRKRFKRDWIVKKGVKQ